MIIPILSTCISTDINPIYPNFYLNYNTYFKNWYDSIINTNINTIKQYINNINITPENINYITNLAEKILYNLSNNIPIYNNNQYHDFLANTTNYTYDDIYYLQPIIIHDKIPAILSYNNIYNNLILIKIKNKLNISNNYYNINNCDIRWTLYHKLFSIKNNNNNNNIKNIFELNDNQNNNNNIDHNNNKYHDNNIIDILKLTKYIFITDCSDVTVNTNPINNNFFKINVNNNTNPPLFTQDENIYHIDNNIHINNDNINQYNNDFIKNNIIKKKTININYITNKIHYHPNLNKLFDDNLNNDNNNINGSRALLDIAENQKILLNSAKSSKTLLNCGIIGGHINTIIPYLSLMNYYINLIKPTHETIDMIIHNYIIYIHNLNHITGPPIHSNFSQYNNPNDINNNIWFIHK